MKTECTIGKFQSEATEIQDYHRQLSVGNISESLQERKADTTQVRQSRKDHVCAVSHTDCNIIEHYRYTVFGELEIYSPQNQNKLAGTAIVNPEEAAAKKSKLVTLLKDAKGAKNKILKAFTLAAETMSSAGLIIDSIAVKSTFDCCCLKEGGGTEWRRKTASGSVTSMFASLREKKGREKFADSIVAAMVNGATNVVKKCPK